MARCVVTFCPSSPSSFAAWRVLEWSLFQRPLPPFVFPQLALQRRGACLRSVSYLRCSQRRARLLLLFAHLLLYSISACNTKFCSKVHLALSARFHFLVNVFLEERRRPHALHNCWAFLDKLFLFSFCKNCRKRSFSAYIQSICFRVLLAGRI